MLPYFRFSLSLVSIWLRSSDELLCYYLVAFLSLYTLTGIMAALILNHNENAALEMRMVDDEWIC